MIRVDNALDSFVVSAQAEPLKGGVLKTCPPKGGGLSPANWKLTAIRRFQVLSRYASINVIDRLISVKDYLISQLCRQGGKFFLHLQILKNQQIRRLDIE